MRTDPYERLERDLIADRRLEEIREQSLTVMVTARRRSHRRRRWQTASIAGLIILAALQFVNRQSATPQAIRLTDVNIAPLPAGSSRVRILTDAELFALLADRPIAIIENGRQKQVLLLERANE